MQRNQHSVRAQIQSEDIGLTAGSYPVARPGVLYKLTPDAVSLPGGGSKS